HELLVEIIASRGGPVDENTAARAISRLYRLGVYPDWWKLEPDHRAATWRNIEAAILEHDPHCRGVVMLGLSAPQDELIASFAVAAQAPIVKGFAVGRTIFADTAEQWLGGAIDDEAAVNELARRFSVLVEAWRDAKQRAQAQAIRETV